ncbi:unnamed protein product, partial [Ixodes pacificus]
GRGLWRGGSYLPDQSSQRASAERAVGRHAVRQEPVAQYHGQRTRRSLCGANHTRYPHSLPHSFRVGRQAHRDKLLRPSQDSDGGPCIVVVPAGRCVLVWKGVPPVYADDYDYLALSSKVALIFEYLAESPGTTYEWLQGADSLGRALTVEGVVVGRSRPMSPDGRLLLGGVLADNSSSSGLFACDGREPLASPLRSFQLLVKRASSH